MFNPPYRKFIWGTDTEAINSWYPRLIPVDTYRNPEYLKKQLYYDRIAIRRLTIALRVAPYGERTEMRRQLWRAKRTYKTNAMVYHNLMPGVQNDPVYSEWRLAKMRGHYERDIIHEDIYKFMPYQEQALTIQNWWRLKLLNRVNNDGSNRRAYTSNNDVRRNTVESDDDEDVEYVGIWHPPPQQSDPMSSSSSGPRPFHPGRA